MPGREEAPTASDAHQHIPGVRELTAAASVFSLPADPTRLHLAWPLTRGESDVTAPAAACARHGPR